MNMYKIKRALYIYKYLIILITSLLFASCHHNKQWTKIKDISKSHHFISNKNEKSTLTVYDANKKPLYYFDTRFNAWKYDDVDYNFSGILDCRLFLVNSTNEPYPTLLQNAENATRDWQTVGRFLYSELIGFAGAPPSRSIIQRCKVRGMYIEIEVNNIICSIQPDKEIKSLDFKVTFINDSTATSAISDQY